MYRIGTQNQWVPAKYVASVQTTVKKSAPAVHVTATPAKTQTSQITKPAVPVVNHNTTSTAKPATPVVNNGATHTNTAKPVTPSKQHQQSQALITKTLQSLANRLSQLNLQNQLHQLSL